MTGKIAFYTNPMSRGQIARWALHEAGADYDPHIVEYADIKSDDYRAVNPMGKVPAIVHEGRTVTECAAICAYLAAAFPDAGLAPEQAELADYYRWLFYAAGPMEAGITNHALGFDPDEKQQRTAGYGSYDLLVDVADEMLESRAYVCGDRFTMADVYVGSQILWGVQFGTLPKRPSFNAYADRLAQRPAYRAAKAIDMELIAAAQG